MSNQLTSKQLTKSINLTFLCLGICFLGLHYFTLAKEASDYSKAFHMGFFVGILYFNYVLVKLMITKFKLDFSDSSQTASNEKTDSANSVATKES